MTTVEYSTIKPPFTLKFWDMSKKELREYFEWFQEMIPQRINILANAVKGTPGFEDWRPDYTPNSLNALGGWLAAQVETRPRTLEELADIAGQSPYPMDRSDSELTNRTFSLAMDVGMYLSQVFLRNHTSLKWDQPFGSKKFINYGQPVLVGGFADNIPWNPVGIAVSLAYGFAKKIRAAAALREIYEKGGKMIRDSAVNKKNSGDTQARGPLE
jgi:hypothetical protein